VRGLFRTSKLPPLRGSCLRIVGLALLPALACLAGCKSTPPTVTVNTSPGGGVNLASAYDVAEGAALDFVVDPGVAGAKVTASNLPKNATFANNVFSFSPDYTQAGLVSVTFTITAGSTVTQKIVAIRVLNVLHIETPALIVVSEGSTAPPVSFPNNEPMGTIVNYSADLTAAGTDATFDPVTGTLSFTPSWFWLDSKPAQLAITVTAETTEPDTGKVDTSTSKVLYQIKEATSFSRELYPLFLYPSTQVNSDAALPANANLVDTTYGHNCLFCHNSAVQMPPAANMDFRPTGSNPASALRAVLVNHPPSSNAMGGSCYGQDPSVMRVVPGDLTKSIWFWKISGTDGAGNPTVPCGQQMPENFQWYWWSVGDQDAWNSCNPQYVAGDNTCHDMYLCPSTDASCKLNSRYVRKAAIWILAGAEDN
jgi:hypothetical protein